MYVFTILHFYNFGFLYCNIFHLPIYGFKNVSILHIKLEERKEGERKDFQDFFFTNTEKNYLCA